MNYSAEHKSDINLLLENNTSIPNATEWQWNDSSLRHISTANTKALAKFSVPVVLVFGIDVPEWC